VGDNQAKDEKPKELYGTDEKPESSPSPANSISAPYHLDQMSQGTMVRDVETEQDKVE
jgi:hypothetical protein